MAKEEKKIKKYIPCIVIFTLCFLASLGIIFLLMNRKENKTFPRDEQKQIVFLGDSNVAFRRNDTDIPELVGKKLNMTTYNCALGGTTAARIDKWNRFDAHYERCCLYELINMIISGEIIPAQDNMKVVLDHYETAQDKLNLLVDMDFSKVDYVFLSYGMNDYLVGLRADDENAPYDDSTYAGALREAIESLKKEFPNMKIIVCSITYFRMSENRESLEYDYGGGTLLDYRNAAEKVASEYDDVYFLDNLTLLGINAENAKDYMSDAMHVNEVGQEMWAENAANLIQEIENNN